MMYGGSALRASAQTGDPFLGGIIKGALKVVSKVAPGPVGMLAGIGAQALGGRPQIQTRPPARRTYRQRGLPQMPGTGGMVITPTGVPGLPVIPTPTGVPVRQTKEGGVTTRKRPRMNPNNPRALMRAVRRLESHQRQEQRINKALRKIAPPRRRGARRDLPAGHVHVR